MFAANAQSGEDTFDACLTGIAAGGFELVAEPVVSIHCIGKLLPGKGFHFFGECFDFPVQGEDIRKAIMHFLDDSAIAVKDGFLGQITDFCIFGTGHSSRIRLFIAEDQLKQGGLAGTVSPDEADFLAGIEIQPQPVKNHLRSE
jgi:hypothetical protein